VSAFRDIFERRQENKNVLLRSHKKNSLTAASRTAAALAPEDSGGGGEQGEAPEPWAEAPRRRVQAVGARNHRRCGQGLGWRIGCIK